MAAEGSGCRMIAAAPISSAAFDRVSDALHRCGSKQSGKMWSCPAHDDRTPSLSVTAADGRARVHCFAGCDDEDVLHELGLTVPDLFDEPLSGRDKTHDDAPPEYMERMTKRQRSKKGEPTKPVTIHPDLDSLRRAVEFSAGGKIVDEYIYEDEIDGQWREAYRVFRIELPNDDEGNPQKTFRQASPEGNGWKMSRGSARNVPFHFRQLLEGIAAGKTAYIGEGEKDVLAIEAAGGVATCNVGGANKPLEEYAKHFKGASLVRIVADQDADGKGERHARAWAKALRGIVDEIEMLAPIEGKDAHDSLVLRGHALGDAFRVEDDRDAPNIVSLDKIKPEPVEWLVHGYIPKGKIVDVIGDGDLGKSIVLLDIAARMTTGRPMSWEPDTLRRDPINVLLLVAEDDLADTVVPRLIAAGADMSRVKALEGPRKGVEKPITFPEDLGALKETIRSEKSELVIIDPVMAFLGTVRSGIDSEVRSSLMTPLKAIASKYRCSVMSLRHTNKNEGASASMRGGGSTAFRNATRAGLAFGPDHNDEDGERRIMAPSKNNLGRRRDAIAYRIKSTFGRVDSEGSEGTPVVVWEGLVTGVTAADILRPPPKEPGPRENTKTADATEWLRDRLAGGIAVQAKIIQEEMKAAGFSKSVIEAAKRYAGVQSERVSKGNKGKGYSLWSLE